MQLAEKLDWKELTYVGVTYHRTASNNASVDTRIFFPIRNSYTVLHNTNGTASVEHVTHHELTG
jgi:hypothetical protein